jgi:CheY-like chemotaxis protein
VDGELTRRYQGTGLGLTIVRRLVGLMGGSVHAESEVGKGTRVVFDMLARRAPALAAEARSTREARPARPARSLRVLVAEDTPVNQKALTGMLGSLGHTTRVAENGARALEALEQEAFDLVLMDVRMPGLDGLETTRLIRGREDLGAMQRVPIVAVTAHALPGDRERFLAAGMNEYLPKPVRLAELAAVLERLG